MFFRRKNKIEKGKIRLSATYYLTPKAQAHLVLSGHVASCAQTIDLDVDAIEAIDVGAAYVNEEGEFVQKPNPIYLLSALPPTGTITMAWEPTPEMDHLLTRDEALDRYNITIQHRKARMHSLENAAIMGEANKRREKADKEKWIRTHGSTYLMSCLDHGIECDNTYEKERLTKELPGWRRKTDAEDLDPRADPYPDDLAKFIAAKDMWPNNHVQISTSVNASIGTRCVLSMECPWRKNVMLVYPL